MLSRTCIDSRPPVVRGHKSVKEIVSSSGFEADPSQPQPNVLKTAYRAARDSARSPGLYRLRKNSSGVS
jgi:hypothetical protein